MSTFSSFFWLDFDSAALPAHTWRRRLNYHANKLKEFTITFREAIKMVRLGILLWSYVREEASHGRKAPIDPFTKENCKPSASQGVPLEEWGVLVGDIWAFEKSLFHTGACWRLCGYIEFPSKDIIQPAL
ncbi:unnamed protein product [Eruca vesicaria subsp. sativa]|uniref:Uncharacterized protein n=1 Tax=Eruca vesicaria subsp. sativa TaxID=29727 RepID=A0ABC8IS62_ERUVS|nr:unnamed protein product [Eruca vesicaria subsp. sativa]